MLVLVIVLVVTNLATLGALVWLYLRPAEHPRPDSAAADALDRSPRPPSLAGSTRRLISVEILNPIELAWTKGRLAGIAGSLVPGLTRRIVYDQTLKILERQLVEQQVVADVRLHTLRPVGEARDAVTRPSPRSTEPVAYDDDVARIDLDRIDDQRRMDEHPAHDQQPTDDRPPSTPPP